MSFLSYGYDYSGDYNSCYFWASSAFLCSILHINMDAKTYTAGIITQSQSLSQKRLKELRWFI